MKKSRLFSAGILLIITVILGIAVFMQMRDASKYTIFEPYQYPIVPSTPQWVALKSNIDKINACRVPEELAAQMSTDALLETFLMHPLAGNMFAFDNYHGGFVAIRDYHHTALGELMQRDDLGKEILKKYNRKPADMVETALLEVLAVEMEADRGSILLVNAIAHNTKERRKNMSKYGGFADVYFRTLKEKLVT